MPKGGNRFAAQQKDKLWVSVSTSHYIKYCLVQSDTQSWSCHLATCRIHALALRKRQVGSCDTLVDLVTPTSFIYVTTNYWCVTFLLDQKMNVSISSLCIFFIVPSAFLVNLMDVLSTWIRHGWISKMMTFRSATVRWNVRMPYALWGRATVICRQNLIMVLF